MRGGGALQELLSVCGAATKKGEILRRYKRWRKKKKNRLTFTGGLPLPQLEKKADVKENDSSVLIKTSVGISLTPVAKH